MPDLTMTPAEHREHALRIASDLLTNAEFCEVYEDDELESATEDDLQAIHTLILNSTPALPEDDLQAIHTLILNSTPALPEVTDHA